MWILIAVAVLVTFGVLLLLGARAGGSGFIFGKPLASIVVVVAMLAMATFAIVIIDRLN